MKTKTIYSLLIFGIVMSIMSCTSAKFISAESYLIKPGVPTGTSSVRYDFKVKVSDDSKFSLITIGDKEISKFSVTNVESNMQSDNSTSYEKGTYLLRIDLPKQELANAVDQSTAKVTLTIKEKSKSITKVIEVLKDKQLR